MLKAALLATVLHACLAAGCPLSGANALRAVAADRFDPGAACRFNGEFEGGGGSMLKEALLAIVLLACTAVDRALSGANLLRPGSTGRFHPGAAGKFPREVVRC